MVVPVTEARSSAVRPRATGTPAARCHGAHLMSYRHLQSDLQQADRGPVPAPRRPQPEGGAWASSQEQPPAWGAGPPRCGPPAGVRTFRRCRSPGPTPAQRAGSARSASVRAEETGRGEERGRGRGADGGGSWGSCHVTHRSPGSLTAPPAVAGAFGGGGSSGDLVSWSPDPGLGLDCEKAGRGVLARPSPALQDADPGSCEGLRQELLPEERIGRCRGRILPRGTRKACAAGGRPRP
ncbi:translation initiation factor IF-2-like isoform X2 [Lemur catta]|uniref:translation initiation factor IF-2-like isoform X2 n=1 Tax=Lemur catta TaxID=9447 RepID=UPI001E26E228|nr:translation initiation factor IF-2-like isoform X2 [Lemur catta]